MKRPEAEDLRVARPERAHSSQIASLEGAISVELLRSASEACGEMAASAKARDVAIENADGEPGLGTSPAMYEGVM
jgi:hypothetical protein